MLKRIRIDITDNCNLRCPHCQIYAGVSKTNLKFFDFELFKNHSQGYLSDLQIFQVGNIAEPLLHPQFDKFVSFVRAENPTVDIQVITNGNLLHRYADVINDTGCRVVLSLDSMVEETYNYVREGGKLSRVLHNLTLLDHSKVKVILTMVMMNINIDEYGHWIEFCRENGYQMSGMPMCLRESQGVIQKNLIDQMLWFNKPKLNEWIDKYYEKDFDDVVTGVTSGVVKMDITEFNCSAHHDDLMILGDGSSILCFKQNIGDLNKSDLNTIWLSDKAVNFREAIDNNTTNACKICDYRTVCLNPSIKQFRNHVSKSIYVALPREVRNLLAYSNDLTDSEQKEIFIEALSKNFKIYNFKAHAGLSYAIPLSLGDIDLEEGTQRNLPGISFEKTQIKLEQLLMADSRSPHSPALLESYQGYNLVDYNNEIYAVPLSLGPVDLTNEADELLPGIIVSKTVPKIKELVDQIVSQTLSLPGLLESYRGYNLVSYDNYIFGVPIFWGVVDLTNEEHRNREGIVVGNSVRDVKNQISQISYHTLVFSPPELLESYKGYNLVKYNWDIYGIPIFFGPVDLTNEDDRKQPGIIKAESVKDVKEMIDQLIPHPLFLVGRKIAFQYHQGGVPGLAHHTLKFIQKRLSIAH